MYTQNLNKEELYNYANLLRNKIESLTIIVEEKYIKCTISVGATVKKDNDTLDIFLKRADIAMYQVKSEGRNQVILL